MLRFFAMYCRSFSSYCFNFSSLGGGAVLVFSFPSHSLHDRRKVKCAEDFTIHHIECVYITCLVTTSPPAYLFRSLFAHISFGFFAPHQRWKLCLKKRKKRGKKRHSESSWLTDKREEKGKSKKKRKSEPTDYDARRRKRALIFRGRRASTLDIFSKKKEHTEPYE